MRLRLLMLSAILLLPACIPLTTPGATGNNVYVGNYFFTPVIDTAPSARNDSATVTFRWADSTSGVGHTIVWDSLRGGVDSVLPGNDGLQFTGTFDVSLGQGRYYYHCSVHGGPLNDFGMDGQIVVLPFGYTPPQTAQRTGNVHPTPAPALVTQPAPRVARENLRAAARRSQPATS